MDLTSEGGGLAVALARGGGVLALFLVLFAVVARSVEARRAKTEEPSAPPNSEVAKVARAFGLEFVGWVYDPKVGDLAPHRPARDITVARLRTKLKMLRKCAGHYLRRLMVGPYGDSALLCFDYEGFREFDEARAASWGFVGAQLPVNLPEMSVRPEGPARRMAQQLGWRDLKVELDEFNRRYYVSCRNARRANELLTPSMIEHFMSLPALTWYLQDNYVVIVYPGGLTPESVGEGLRAIAGFIDRIPRYVQSDFSAPRPNV